MQIIQIYNANDIQRTNFIKELKDEYSQHLNDIVIYTNEVINFAEPVDYTIVGDDYDTEAEVIQKFKNYITSFFRLKDVIIGDGNFEIHDFLDSKFCKHKDYIFTLMPVVKLQNKDYFYQRYFEDYIYFLGERGWKKSEPNFIYFVMRQFIDKILFRLKNLCYLRPSATESNKVQFLENEYKHQREFYAECVTP